MAKGNNSEYKKMIDKQYSDLMKHCQVQMEKIEKDLPEPKEDFQAVLKEHGVSRRDFIKWTSAMTAALMLPPIFRPMVAKQRKISAAFPWCGCILLNVQAVLKPSCVLLIPMLMIFFSKPSHWSIMKH